MEDVSQAMLVLLQLYVSLPSAGTDESLNQQQIVPSAELFAAA